MWHLYKISILVALVVLSACGGGAKRGQMEAGLMSVNDDIKDIRTIQAQQTASLEDIRSELRELSGKVEELQFGVRGKTDELERTLQQFGTRVPPPAGVPEDILVLDEKKISGMTGAAADSYRDGLVQMRAGNFQGARKTFLSFAEENPDTSFSDNALFWVGISFARMGQHDRAIVAYSDVFQRYPAEDRVPAALYYLAESFVEMGSKEDAILTLEKLIAEHPKSDYAKKAKTRISELKPKKRRRR